MMGSLTLSNVFSYLSYLTEPTCILRLTSIEMHRGIGRCRRPFCAKRVRANFLPLPASRSKTLEPEEAYILDQFWLRRGVLDESLRREMVDIAGSATWSGAPVAIPNFLSELPGRVRLISNCTS